MKNKEEMLARIKILAGRDILTIIEANEARQFLDDYYRAASDVPALLWGREMTWRLEETMARSCHSVSVMARTLNSGWYMAYHYLLKTVPRDSKGAAIYPFLPEYQSGIDQLAKKICAYFSMLDSEQEPVLWVNYGSLLVLIESQLKLNKEKAKEIEDKIQKKALEIEDPAVWIKVKNTQGLMAEKEGNFKKAAGIFEEVPRKFPEARGVPPHAMGDYGHTLNNSAKIKILSSDGIKAFEQKRGFLLVAVGELRKAIRTYNRAPYLSAMHYEGVKNRLAMVAFRWLEISGQKHLRESGEEIKKQFEGGDRTGAIEKIKKVFQKQEIKVLEQVVFGIKDADMAIKNRK